MLQKSRCLMQIPRIKETLKATKSFSALLNVRYYAKKTKGDDCRKALKDIPPDVDPECPHPCERRKKKEGILHRIKLKVVEGGTNFGTPFRRLECWKKREEPKENQIVKTESKHKSLALPAPKKEILPVPDPRPGVQVSILGADTAVGQYIALLLKQCPCIKKLRLYEAKDTQCSPCDRDLCNVVQDLQHIDTNCLVQMFSCGCFELERCLQNTDIVLMLESGCLTPNMPLEKRFCYQAPIVKRYADVISTECPRAFVIVCATPIDCMVPLIAETLKESGWYDPRKLLGSMAVPEMRTSTLAARALCLEPRYTRVPCVGGTEGEALVPLFSKAVEYFQFSRSNATMMTETIRDAASAVSRSDKCCARAADLSEAHAVTGLVKKVAHAMLCQDIPRVSGYVETDSGQIISPARFIASTVELSGSGIIKHFGLPKLNDYETTLVNFALNELDVKVKMVYDWYHKYSMCSGALDAYQLYFLKPKPFLSIDVLLNKNGICKKYDFPDKMTPIEMEYMDTALAHIKSNVDLAQGWFNAHIACKLKKFDWQAFIPYDDSEPIAGGFGEGSTAFYTSDNDTDKLLNKLEENEPELASSPEEECVICVNAKATMQTSPCGHRVVCRRCFVKTIQMAVSQRLLPLRCVICRAKILRLRQAPRLVTSKSWQVTSNSSKSWGVPGSVSSYSVGARSVPASASLYSVTSGESSLSGLSSVSSNSSGTVSNSCNTKLCGGAKCGGSCLGAVPRVGASASVPSRPRQPASHSLRSSQHHSMKARIQEYQMHSYTGGPAGESSGRLPPIREFQREFREGRRESAAASTSTRIRCAQKIVTQLEVSPQKGSQHFFRPLKPCNKDDKPTSRDHSKETDHTKENPKSKSKKEEKKKNNDENIKQDKSKKEEGSDNKKNEIAERKKEEKLRLKAEKEAKKEAKQQAKIEERQAKLLAKEEEKQAKLLAKEEKKKAKKEAKLAAQAEKEKNK